MPVTVTQYRKQEQKNSYSESNFEIRLQDLHTIPLRNGNLIWNSSLHLKIKDTFSSLQQINV